MVRSEVSNPVRLTVTPALLPQLSSNLTQSEVLSNCGYGSHTVRVPPVAAALEEAADGDADVADDAGLAGATDDADDAALELAVVELLVEPPVAVDELDEHATNDPATATAMNPVRAERRTVEERVTLILPWMIFCAPLHFLWFAGVTALRGSTRTRGGSNRFDSGVALR